jgi:E3 ubiquitin-protein ligase RNF19A
MEQRKCRLLSRCSSPSNRFNLFETNYLHFSFFAFTKEADRDSKESSQSCTNHAKTINDQDSTKATVRECPLCIESLPSSCLSEQLTCNHLVCDSCLLRYLCVEIDESRINLKCPSCDQQIHPNLIYETLKTHEKGAEYVRKYEQFMLRRVLITEQDARWCPAPDCNYIVIASGCASCPSLRCARPDCRTMFCYHCKQQWHPDQTCDSARVQRGKQFRHSPSTRSQNVSSADSLNSPSFRIANRLSSPLSTADTVDSAAFTSSTPAESSDLKPCPSCGVLIIKMNDGSCNHMTCTVCLTEFCWLCMKRISDLHYLSPSGCTFWGKKPWSRKKKIFWQIGMLIGAPVGIALIAGIAVPTIVVGIPFWFGRKLRARLISQSVGRRKRTLLVTSGVISSAIVSPFVAAIVVGIGVPVMLTYVYGVVPLTLVRSGVCGLSTTASGVRIQVNEEHSNQTSQGFDDVRVFDLPKASGTLFALHYNAPHH